MKKKANMWILIIAVCFYIASAVMLYKGYDKITNYYMSENYSSLNENAYVGGDAYNYIINGNYATGFFVLSMGFLITGTICLSAAAIIKNLPENAAITTPVKNDEEIEEKKEELPDL